MEGVIRKAFEDAIAGNDKARQFIVDRGWGKAVDKIAAMIVKAKTRWCYCYAGAV